MFRQLSLLIAVLVCPIPAAAHFPFLHWTTLDETPVLQVYFGESPAPDQPEFLARLVDGKAWMKTADGEPKSVALAREGDFLLARPQVDQPAVFGFQKDWGAIRRGEESFQLLYCAKTYSDPKAWEIETGELLPLDIRPRWKEGQLTVTVLWQNKPLSDAEVVVQGGVDFFEGKTNAQGEFQCDVSDAVLYAVRARQIVPAGQGDAENARRYYATATFPLPVEK